MAISHEYSLLYCYEILHHQFNLTQNQPVPDQSLTQIQGNVPLFITIYTHGSDKTLRGCIGTFAPNFRTFADALSKYVHQAAFCDSRFAPLSATELTNDNVTLSLNVLHTFENTRAWDDWEIGVHGTTIYFEDKNGRTKNATFLPSVAKSHNFSKLKAIEQLRRKAGGNAKFSGDDFFRNLRVERYQSSESDMSYAEFLSRCRN